MPDITPPPELVQQWNTEGRHQDYCTLTESIATRAAQWGADQELEACCEWLHWQNLATHSELIPSLRAARRPKPPSLKEKALEGLTRLVSTGEFFSNQMTDLNTIRRALEALPND
jgi:hypothetical protein